MTCMSCAVSVKLVMAVEPSAGTVYRQEPLMPAAHPAHAYQKSSRHVHLGIAAVTCWSNMTQTVNWD